MIYSTGEHASAEATHSTGSPFEESGEPKDISVIDNLSHFHTGLENCYLLFLNFLEIFQRVFDYRQTFSPLLNFENFKKLHEFTLNSICYKTVSFSGVKETDDRTSRPVIEERPKPEPEPTPEPESISEGEESEEPKATIESGPAGLEPKTEQEPSGEANGESI